jgi:hypothetical protein
MKTTDGWDTADLGSENLDSQLIEGKMLHQRQEDAEFFAWYDEPTRYRSAEILGVALSHRSPCTGPLRWYTVDRIKIR